MYCACRSTSSPCFLLCAQKHAPGLELQLRQAGALPELGGRFQLGVGALHAHLGRGVLLEERHVLAELLDCLSRAQV
eukprot:2463453-Lingulodinium_polyedra.AAC.1